MVLLARTTAAAIAAALLPLLFGGADANENYVCNNDDTNDCYCNPFTTEAYCGGGDESGDVWTQMSCTPYAYRPNTFNLANGLTPGMCGCAPNCDDPYLDVMSYGTGYVYGNKDYPNSDTNAWSANPDPAEWWLHGSTSKDDYFVFHGCDGAGIQSDCAGDIKYIERFNGLYSGGDIDKGYGTIPGEGICEGGPDGRNYCKFVHPGTMRVFDQYVGGWWGSTCESDADYNPNNMFGDPGMGCFNTNDCGSLASGGWDGKLCQHISDIPNKHGFNGRHPFADEEGSRFSFLLFPWRCDGGTGLDSNRFSYPTIEDWGSKCYVDNEPTPPYLEIYFGIITGLGKGEVPTIKLYRFDSDSSYDVKFINEGDPYYLYSVAFVKEGTKQQPTPEDAEPAPEVSDPANQTTSSGAALHVAATAIFAPLVAALMSEYM